MSRISYGRLALMMLVAALVWSSNFEACMGRRGRHWRHSRVTSSTLAKKKGKTSNHSSSHHSSGSKLPKPKLKQKPKPKPKAPTLPPRLPPTPSPSTSPPLPPPSMSPPPPPYSKAPLPPPPYSKAPLPPPPYSKAPLLPPVPTPSDDQGYAYNVLDFGAKGDGRSDDTKAFQAAWAAACKVEASKLIVPADYQFLVGPISFSGPYCQPNILFQLDGTIVAPSDTTWGKGLFQWLEFTKLRGITIQGNGVIDGRGSPWWQDAPYADPYDDELKLIIPLNSTHSIPIRNELNGKIQGMKPTALRFYGSYNVTVTGITIQNSPQCHLKFDNCDGVLVHDLNVSSPGDSPNTDGIHLQNSKDVLIHSSSLACGDDCISIQTGCSNIYVHNVNCGPGHGISIGSLGKDNTKACVSNITVRDVVMHNTMNGVRVKTWQGGSGSVQGVLFSNIQVNEVQLPIVIDQFYCDKGTCRNQSSAVALSGITYERIRGTYTVKPVHFACSDALPCVDVTLNSIELKPVQERYHMYDPFCWQTFGELRTPTLPPIACLQIGKPANNKVNSDHDACDL